MFINKLKSAAVAALVATVAAVGTFGATTAQAETVASCPESAILGRTFLLEPSSGCYAYGKGNIYGTWSDPILAGATIGHNALTFGSGQSHITGLEIVDKSDSIGFALDGILGGTLSGGTRVGDMLAGTINVGSNTSGWENFILTVKVGGGVNPNSPKPSWAAFLIGGAGSYDFTIDPQLADGVTHVNLYATQCVQGEACGGDISPVPLPASLPLMLAGIGAGAFFARRKRKSA